MLKKIFLHTSNQLLCVFVLEYEHRMKSLQKMSSIKSCHFPYSSWTDNFIIWNKFLENVCLKMWFPASYVYQQDVVWINASSIDKQHTYILSTSPKLHTHTTPPPPIFGTLLSPQMESGCNVSWLITTDRHFN